MQLVAVRVARDARELLVLERCAGREAEVVAGSAVGGDREQRHLGRRRPQDRSDRRIDAVERARARRAEMPAPGAELEGAKIDALTLSELLDPQRLASGEGDRPAG